MKRVWASVLVLTFLLMAQGLEAASCSKRVLVYLDVSGSMDPGGKKTNSPFRQTVEALQALLQEPDFLQQGDRVEVVLFGAGTQEIAGGGGPSEVGPILDKLRNGNWASYVGEGRASLFADLSDLGAVFENIRQKLEASQDFSRQVVIIASDFVHEPTKKQASYIGAWNSLWGQWQSVLKDQFTETGKTRLLLFQAPPVYNPNRVETGALVQQVVLGSLSPAIVPADQILAIGQPSSDPKVLARSIREKLFNPLTVRASRDPSDQKRLLVTVENQNCYALNVSQVDLQCDGPNSPSDGDSVSYGTAEIPEDVRNLGESGKEGAVRNIPLPLPQGNCWQEPTGFSATVFTKEGARGSSEGTTGSWFSYRPVRAIVEDNIFSFGGQRKVLRLELEMKGLHVDDKSFHISLHGDSGDVATGQFISPESLNIDRFKRYRLVFPVGSHSADLLNGGSSLKVVIDGAQLGGEGQVKVEEDKLSSLGNGMQLILTFTAWAGGIFTLFRRKKALDGLQKAVDLYSLVLTIGQPLIGLLILALNYFRAYLLEALSLQLADILRWSSVFLVAFLAVLLPVQQFRRERLEAEVRSVGIPDFNTYKRRVSSGWISYVIAISVSLSFVVVAVLALPENDEIRKAETQPVETIELAQS